MSAATGVAAVIPAWNEADRIGATIGSARTIEGVDVVVVVDDGSTDGTADVARGAGALVVRHARNRGKAAAMESGAAAVDVYEQQEASPDGAGRRALLFIDGDLGRTAAGTAPLVGPVLAGDADMTIAVLGRQAGSAGGHGFVVNLSRRGIVAATGFTPTQPLSGMRCLSRTAFEAALPLAPGWGVETALTIDLLRQGLSVLEVPCDLQHRVTGADLRAQLHRAAQYRDVARALLERRVWRAGRPGPRRASSRDDTSG